MKYFMTDDNLIVTEPKDNSVEITDPEWLKWRDIYDQAVLKDNNFARIEAQYRLEETDTSIKILEKEYHKIKKSYDGFRHSRELKIRISPIWSKMLYEIQRQIEILRVRKKLRKSGLSTIDILNSEEKIIGKD